MLDTIAIIGAATIAAITDAYTGEIPEWLTIPLMISGVIYAWITGFWQVSLVAMLATLAVGYLLYYTGELGGGDVLLLSGISAWKPFITILGIQIPSALAILVLGLLLSSVFFSVYYSLQLGRKDARFYWIITPYAVLPAIWAAAYGATVTATLGQRYRNELFVRERRVEDLVPEDVLAEPVDVLPPGKKVLEKKDIEVLREKGIQTVKILDNLPRFGPFILAALLLLIYVESNSLELYNNASALFSLNISLYP